MTEIKVISNIDSSNNLLFGVKMDDNKVIKYMVSFLGYIEIYAAFNFWFDSNERLSNKFGIIPQIVIENNLVRFIYITFILMLGMQRLTWAHGITSSRITFYYWMNLVYAHGIETIFWWNLAGYKFSHWPIQIILVECLNGRFGMVDVSLLIGLPLLTLYFFCCGVKETKYMRDYYKRTGQIPIIVSKTEEERKIEKLKKKINNIKKIKKNAEICTKDKNS